MVNRFETYFVAYYGNLKLGQLGQFENLVYVIMSTSETIRPIARAPKFVCLFCCFTPQVNSYGHGGTVSSPKRTFVLGKLEQALNQYFVHILLLVTDNNPS